MSDVPPYVSGIDDVRERMGLLSDEEKKSREVSGSAEMSLEELFEAEGVDLSSFSTLGITTYEEALIYLEQLGKQLDNGIDQENTQIWTSKDVHKMEDRGEDETITYQIVPVDSKGTPSDNAKQRRGMFYCEKDIKHVPINVCMKCDSIGGYDKETCTLICNYEFKL